MILLGAVDQYLYENSTINEYKMDPHSVIHKTVDQTLQERYSLYEDNSLANDDADLLFVDI